MAVFFDVEKAYDMVWKEALMIKLDMIGITGRIYNWIKDFLFDRFIQVRIGKVLSGRYMVENIPPGQHRKSNTLFNYDK